MARRIRSLNALVILLAITTGSLPAVARDKDWFKYENRYFDVYSDASRRQVLDLLEELEKFRAALFQMSQMRPEEDAPKTQILILSSRSDFEELAGNEYIDGFAASVKDVPYLVFPARRFSFRDNQVLRHEYAHALLAYKGFAYPDWFHEGFAELISATRFQKRNTEFTIGRPTDRKMLGGQPLIRWDALIAEDFKIHDLEQPALASEAYVQSWLLTHYILLADNFSHVDSLADYFRRISGGENSVQAFESAFGEDINDFGSRVFETYSKELPYVIYAFNMEALDQEFQRTEAAASAVRLKLEYFRFSRKAALAPNPPDEPLTAIVGNWDSLAIDSYCDDPKPVSVDRTANRFAFAGGTDASGNPAAAKVFAFEEVGEGVFHLTDENEITDDNSRVDLRLSMKSADLICISPLAWPEDSCGVMSVRCPD